MNNIMPVGSVITAGDREYTILQFIGRGATSAAYLASCRNGDLVSRCILKEYAPDNADTVRNEDGSLYSKDIEAFTAGKDRFKKAAKMQNSIRQMSMLVNQTPPVSHLFEANNTAYVEVSCYNGTTLDKAGNIGLLQYIEIARTIAKTVSYYHKSGLMCFDLKPENIFILQNAPDDTITQLVEFIDFDSIYDPAAENKHIFSYTRNWAAPELKNPYSAEQVGVTADIYAVGEIVFHLLFGRHSTDTEHRGFSRYPFDKCDRAYRKVLSRPDIQSLFTRFFRGTLRSSALNRFDNMEKVAHILDDICEEINKKEFIIPIIPPVSPNFVGRDKELREISQKLKTDPVLFVTGVGGIGKSSLVRNYIKRSRTEYDVLVYMEYEGNIQHTFCDDKQLAISTIKRFTTETDDEYFNRKLSYFKEICADRKILFVIDNYSGRITRELSDIIGCGYDMIIITRDQPPKNSFASIEIKALTDADDLFRLITLNLERNPTKEERGYFEKIISLVMGHTLVIELIARQIAAGDLNVQSAYDLIEENGFSRFSDDKIANFKDGEEVYDTLGMIISVLFDTGKMSEENRIIMKVLAMFGVRGLEKDIFFDILGISGLDKAVDTLAAHGWVYSDDTVHMHPVIAETFRKRAWEDSISDVRVMELFKKIVDIYVGMGDAGQVLEIVKESEEYAELHPRHYIKAMYYDMLGDYYDTMLDGRYIAYNEEEADLQENLINAIDNAVAEMEQSSQEGKEHQLVKMYLSLASVLIRDDPRNNREEVSDILAKIDEFLGKEPQYTENQCYFRTVSAWYFTLIDPYLARMTKLMEEAKIIAENVFPTDLERIDIIYIPYANCLFYHNEFEKAGKVLYDAIALCDKNPGKIPYIDKKTELLNCLIDVYMDMGEIDKCSQLAAEIDAINDKYGEQGVSRQIDPEIRQKLNI